MTLRNLPKAELLARPKGFEWDAPSDALGRWADLPLAAEADEPNTISIYDVIGEDWWTGGGFTSARLAGALRAIGPKPVTVKINSPGGDMFEGISMYNLLREHPAKVSIEVMGYAASAASVIAMAGDDVAMGRGSMLMIHKAWGLVIGNDDDFRAAADLFGKFNAAMVEIYAARTGMKDADVLAMLAGDGKGADGTWLTAGEAVDKKFADRLIDDQPAEKASAKVSSEITSRRRVEAALAKDGVPRRERGTIINSMAGKRDAARTAPRDAGPKPSEAFLAELAKLTSKLKA
jgi:ATP-dependent Clp protease protease subunit